MRMTDSLTEGIAIAVASWQWLQNSNYIPNMSAQQSQPSTEELVTNEYTELTPAVEMPFRSKATLAFGIASRPTGH